MSGGISSRNRISSVALGLFIKKGIKSTTTKQIAIKAGLAEGTIYKHFKSKDDLALELFISNMDMFKEKLLENSKNYTDPKQMLKALIQAFFDFAKNQPEAYSYIMDAHIKELKKIPKEKIKPKDIFVRVILSGIKKGDFRNIDENLGAALVIGMVTRTIFFLNNGLIGLGYDEIVKEVVNSAIRVLER
jgi:AcrR family transcriptional regulator